MELEALINKKSEKVFEYFYDMQKFVSVHPIIYRVDHIKGNEYKVYEKLKLFFIPFDFTYPVTVLKSETEKKVTIKALVKKIVHIHMDITITDKGESSIVKENIAFRSFLPVHLLMKKIFTEQHKQLFLNLEKS
jgi:hypothetical protein